MFSTPRDRPGPLIAHQLQALERYRRGLAEAELRAAEARTQRYASNQAANASLSRPRRIYQWLLDNGCGDAKTIRDALGLTKDEFRNAVVKLHQKNGLIRRKRRGFYEVV